MNRPTILRILFLVTSLFITQTTWAQRSLEASLKEHVHILASDSLAGRAVGTEGEKAAAAYISRHFESCSLEFIYPNGIQDFSVINQHGDTLHSQNIVGIVVGNDPKLREEYIVIGAHYDHLGSQIITIDGRDSLIIYPGADDNALGVALLLELAKVAAQQPYLYKRSLVFVAFGAEEMGMIGSWYFVHRAFSPIDQTVFMINIDMIGRSGARNPFSAYTVAPNKELADLLQEVDVPPYMAPRVIETEYFPSDHQIFFANNIPVVLLTSGLHTDYHRPGDNPNLLDYGQAEQRMAYIKALLIQIANSDELPSSSGRPDDNMRIYSFGELDRLPRFQKGDEAQFVRQWVNKYLKYPNNAIAQGIQGRVLVRFVIEADGSITHVEVVESIDPLLDDEAIRVVSASPKWTPGRKKGKAVRAQCVVPVYFVLKRR
ncbi:MAG: TonB family protein [Bacteroidales bacterium]|nr:TonB family protein [Bacteroidales bacterium]